MTRSTPLDIDVRVWREDGRARTNVQRTVVWHSPDGFEFGYGGSGPADLALNILCAFFPPRDGGDDDEAPVPCFRGVCSAFAARHHQAFKREFIATMDKDGGTIPAATVRAWIIARRPE